MHSISIGSLKLRLPVVYASLAGYSDFPFRKMSAMFFPGLMFCEMIKVEALLRKIPKTFQILKYSESMRPIGAQLCGSRPEEIGLAGRIVEDMGFDVIDLNCGCPTDRITKDGSGSGLLRSPLLLGKLVENLCASVKVPVTVKIRSGWDNSSINVQEVCKIIEEAGASAIFVHGRTVKQGYVGLSNRENVKLAKKAVSGIPVFGNGDVFDASSAWDLLNETGCDGVLVARGTIGQPWIVKHIEAQLQGKNFSLPGFVEKKEMFLTHLNYINDFYNNDERRLLTEAKKLCGWYLVSAVGVKRLRSELAVAKTTRDVFDLISKQENVA